MNGLLRAGVDVGGTNTDAVIMRGDRLLAATKAPTSADVTTGVQAALRDVLQAAQLQPTALQAVMLGTTHFTNALVERARLAPVGVVRLALPATTAVPPFADWPSDLVEALRGHVAMMPGGHEFDGRVLRPIDPGELRRTAGELRRLGLRQVAISGVFSPVNPQAEEQAATLLREAWPDLSVTLSHRLGGIGLLERENAAVLNAALMPEAARVMQALRQALEAQGIAAPLFISQNDGTLMTPEQIAQFPVLTFASGPTNSMRGAAYLTGLKDALVVDIGGTTSDVGALVGGFPRQAGLAVRLAGVRTNFRMPDLLAKGLGGGSIVRQQPQGGVTVGPDSVGFELTRKAQVFGGDVLTATDIAVAAGRMQVGDAARVAGLPPALVQQALAAMRGLLEDTIDRVRTSAEAQPVILVGGGAALAGDALAGAASVHTPEHAGCANAIGASIAQVSGEFDSILTYPPEGRDEALAVARREACARAVAAGAQAEGVQVYAQEEIPMAYLPGGGTRVRVKAVGPLGAGIPGAGMPVSARG